MANYQKMYSLLFNEISDALEEMDQQNFGLAKKRLLNAQLHAEALFIEENEIVSPSSE